MTDKPKFAIGGDPASRARADVHYGRQRRPHGWSDRMGTEVPLDTPEERAAYYDAYDAASGPKGHGQTKVY